MQSKYVKSLVVAVGALLTVHLLSLSFVFYWPTIRLVTGYALIPVAVAGFAFFIWRYFGKQRI